ncbi:MAG: DUF4286 family protein [Bacteroidales bacterium]
MIIFNTTYHVEMATVDDFVTYVRNQFVPAATRSEELTHPRLTRILSHEDEGGVSFALQFQVTDPMKLDDWYDEIGDELNEEFVANFGEKVVGFSTLMEVIDL